MNGKNRGTPANRKGTARASKKNDKGVSARHPLVGTWAEEENAFHSTTVVYTIRTNKGHFAVSGVDLNDGIALTISDTKWDGEKLHFVSLFPPTRHQANHEFMLTGKRTGQPHSKLPR